ncbi:MULTISPECIES: SDR family NAD(P)-dependent oxidoreductase [unclassified Microbacterium]|uniref:SDR family NAD(P)-dependent oxidoreductase n=1 Tax=unclassified Microbacterium TaxID=2609290 RepID=UPI00344A290C
MTTTKNALVFGGSRGIGAAAAKRLAADGYTVAFTYVSRPDAAEALVRAIEAEGGSALAVHADSSEVGQIRAAVAEVVDRVGRLDAVVVNAGILRVNLAQDVSVAELDEMLAVNVRGVFLSVQAVIPVINEGGSIITIGSNVALRGGPGSSVYHLTKSAVAGMVKSIAMELAPRRITINNVQPGPFDTDMNAGAIDILTAQSPLGRVGRLEEVGGLISYLAGDESRYVTGADFTIDGGWVLR